jgi:hypothetical protein
MGAWQWPEDKPVDLGMETAWPEDAVVELDDSLGAETIELVACPQPFVFAEIARSLPEDCVRTSRVIHKASPLAEFDERREIDR